MILKSCVLLQIKKRNIYFQNNRKAKEQWFGVMEPLPSEVYNEIYQTTGIDLDDYRAKVYSCIQDLKPDIDAFLKYLCRLPDFQNFSLKDRTLIARGLSNFLLFSIFYYIFLYFICFSLFFGEAPWKWYHQILMFIVS